MRPALLMVVLVASGCGGSSDASQTSGNTGTAATPATESASDPFGDYERDVGQDEIVTVPGQEAPPAGTWHLTLGPTIIQVVDAGGFRYSQELAVSGDTLEIERYLGGDGIFCENDKPSMYRWELDGDQLTLVPTADECRDRRLILDAEWQRVG